MDNLFAIVDYNGLMCDDMIDSIIPMGNIPLKWRAFGWDVEELDGHDVEALSRSLERCVPGGESAKSVHPPYCQYVNLPKGMI
jgi:transketolase